MIEIKQQHVDAGADARGSHLMAVMSHVQKSTEFVDREEVANPVAELLGHEADVAREGLGRVARLPPALVLQPLRQLPMIERGERHDAEREWLSGQAWSRRRRTPRWTVSAAGLSR